MAPTMTPEPEQKRDVGVIALWMVASDGSGQGCYGLSYGWVRGRGYSFDDYGYGDGLNAYGYAVRSDGSGEGRDTP